jgi:hypothetical protein
VAQVVLAALQAVLHLLQEVPEYKVPADLIQYFLKDSATPAAMPFRVTVLGVAAAVAVVPASEEEVQPVDPLHWELEEKVVTV